MKVSIFIWCSIIVLTSLSIRLYDLNAEGVTYDEPVYQEAGKTYIKNIVNNDYGQSSWLINKEHPPITKYIYGTAFYAGTHIFHIEDTIQNKFTAARLISAILGSLTVGVTFLIGYSLFSIDIAIISALILSLIPQFIAYTRLAGHESIMTFLCTLTVYFFILYFKNTSYRPFYFICTIISFCLAFATRFNSLILYPLLVIFYFLFTSIKLDKDNKNFSIKVLKYVLIIIMPGIALGFLFIIWPFWWTDPLQSIMVTFTHWGGDVKSMFLGTYQRPPLYYYLTYFLITTPGVLLILFAIYLSIVIKKTIDLLFLLPKKRGDEANLVQKYTWQIFILCWFLTPFLWSFSHLRQGGLRYLVLVLPPLAIMCGIALDKLQRFKGVKKTYLFGIVIIYLLVIAKGVHPFYLDYYNEFAGGPKNVQANNIAEVGFWGQGTNKAIEWVNNNADQNKTVAFFTVLGPEHLSRDMLRPDLGGIYRADVENSRKADYLIVNSFMKDVYFSIPENYHLIHTLTFNYDRTPLFFIYRKN